MKVVVVIPARGGSKGIPRKNIAPVCGNPLISYTINSSLNAKLVSRVIVSTDDYEIADISKKYGAEVIIRPSDISGDTATSESAILHVLEQLRKKENYQPDIVLLVQCTSPLTSVEEIDGCINLLKEDLTADSSFAACPFFYFLWKTGEDNSAVGINHEGGLRKRRQDIEPQYLESGSVYAMRTNKFLETQNRFCGKTVMYKMPDTSSNLEIDEPIDLLKAETTVRYHLDQKKLQLIPKHIEGLVVDFDGVFSDNRLLLDKNGDQIVKLCQSDIANIKVLGSELPVLVLTNEHSQVVENICQKLHIDYRFTTDKLSIMEAWLNEKNITSGAWCVGCNMDSIPCLNKADFSIAPNNAHREVKKYASLVLEHSGGEGVIAELAELITQKRNANLSQINYTQGLKDIRPWGKWEVLSVGMHYCIKRIFVKPQGILSLQSHNHRSETWHIIEGEAQVEINGDIKQCVAGDVVKIAVDDKHRISNPSDNETLIFLEIQKGELLDENDIIRYSDVYNRA